MPGAWLYLGGRSWAVGRQSQETVSQFCVDEGNNLILIALGTTKILSRRVNNLSEVRAALLAKPVK